MTKSNLVMLLLGAALAAAGFLWRHAVNKKQRENPEQKLKKPKLLATILMVIGLWFFAGKLLQVIFGPVASEGFHVSIWAERVKVGGFNLSTTVIYTWVIMAVLILGALLLRLFVIPKMTDRPHGIQNVIELCIEAICKYTKSQVGDLGDHLPSYLLSLALYMIGCAVVELFGVRAPTADITMTFSLALITFVLINYYGIRKKGVFGRIKSLAQPTPVVFPMKIVSDLAIPVSLACRLFGNMLGGMIVIDLLYVALGNAAVGIPSVIGLYFNVFHPLIQTFIFVTLTLTFIGEAVE